MWMGWGRFLFQNASPKEERITAPSLGCAAVWGDRGVGGQKASGSHELALSAHIANAEMKHGADTEKVV